VKRLVRKTKVKQVAERCREHRSLDDVLGAGGAPFLITQQYTSGGAKAVDHRVVQLTDLALSAKVCLARHRRVREQAR
jgi:hypothetical protein